MLKGFKFKLRQEMYIFIATNEFTKLLFGKTIFPSHDQETFCASMCIIFASEAIMG